MLTLAFDTATAVATVALVRDGEALGERVTEPRALLGAVEELLVAAGLSQGDLGRIAVGTGPGSFTGIRIGLAAARGLAFALDLPVAGVSTLDALAAGAPGDIPLIDAKRREVFTLGPAAVAAAAFEVEPGRVYVGDGALRYRELLESGGGEVPPDDDERHVPRARFHADLARDYGDAALVEPLYVRVPDAEQGPR